MSLGAKASRVGGNGRELGGKMLLGISQARQVNNLNDGLAWGLFPLFFAVVDPSAKCRYRLLIC